MRTLDAVLIGGLVTGISLVALASLLPNRREPVPVEVEHWLVERSGARPALRRVAAGLDRRVFGGLSLALALTIVTAAGAAVGALFDSLDSQRGFAAWDESVAQWGADHATAQTTAALEIVTMGGATALLLPLMALIGLAGFVSRRSWVALGYLATTGCGIVIVNNTLKLIVDRERPLVDHLVGSSGSSFPSGHSAAAAACWAAIALVAAPRASRNVRALLVLSAAIVALFVAASRALLGVHWLTDVIAGVIVGWSWFLLVSIAFGGRIVRLGEPAVELQASPNTHQKESIR